MQPKKKRILIVDDEPSITRLLKLNLEQTNEYEVRVENDPTAALTAAEAFQPDLALLDVVMPGISGGELANLLQGSPLLKHMRIVFLTAAATKHEVASRNGQIGGWPFLAKPVGLPEVVRCLRQQLGGETAAPLVNQP